MAKQPVTRRPHDELADVMGAIDKGDLDALKSALKCSNVKEALVELLRAERATSRSPIIKAISGNHVEIVRYLLEEFKGVLNLEQVWTITIDNKLIEAAPPLWTAATTGYYEIVKLLVDHGADINHTTKSNSTPIRGAAYDGHTNVVEYLADKGADIHKANNCGQCPLSIAAAMEKVECVNFLLARGANVHQKGHNEDTPLHVCVESGSEGVTELLVKAGALNSPNALGHTPAMLAACHGHHQLVKYFDKQFQLSHREWYNCYCLLGAREMLTNSSTAVSWWTQAISERVADPDTAVYSFSFATPSVYRDLVEPATSRELHQLEDDAEKLLLASLMYEHIMGPYHPSLAFTLRVCGDLYMEKKEFARCTEIWEHSLKVDLASRLAYELQVKEDILFTTRGFHGMLQNGYVPDMRPMVRWSLNELQNAKNNKLSERQLVSAIGFLFGSWVKGIECIKDPTRMEKERNSFEEAIKQLIVIGSELKDTTPLLSMCLSNFDNSKETSTSITKEMYSLELPLEKVVFSLIANGCSLTCADEDRNFPLHYAVKMQSCRADAVVKVLIENGAPLYACNYDGLTALDTCRQCTDRKVEVERLELYYSEHITLQEMCARLIVLDGLAYQKQLPKNLHNFVSWH